MSLLVAFDTEGRRVKSSMSSSIFTGSQILHFAPRFSYFFMVFFGVGWSINVNNISSLETLHPACILIFVPLFIDWFGVVFKFSKWQLLYEFMYGYYFQQHVSPHSLEFWCKSLLGLKDTIPHALNPAIKFSLDLKPIFSIA